MKQSAFLIVVFSITLMACQNQTKPPAKGSAPYLDLSVQDFKKQMTSEPDAVLLDVRTPEEIAEGKIEGAMELDFHADDFSNKVDLLDKDKTYLIYCRSGGRSSDACNIMAEKGFKKLYNLEGGYIAWTKEN